MYVCVKVYFHLFCFVIFSEMHERESGSFWSRNMSNKINSNIITRKKKKKKIWQINKIKQNQTK